MPQVAVAVAAAAGMIAHWPTEALQECGSHVLVGDEKGGAAGQFAV